MSNAQTGCSIVEATLGHLLPASFDSVPARLLLVVTGLQESAFVYRDQSRNPAVIGPALGFWQMEKGGGVHGTLNHPASAGFARQVCRARAVAATDSDAWLALKQDDLFACALARLSYFTDPAPLPAVGDVEGAKAYYRRVWRPGAWTRADAAGDTQAQAQLDARWAQNYADACAALGVTA